MHRHITPRKSASASQFLLLHARVSIREEGNIHPHANVQTTANDFFSLIHERFSTKPKSCTGDTPRPFVGADQYLLASLVQKAIRRGDVTIARRAAHQLLALDPSRLWRRLRVIALEDIGIGDMDVAAEMVGIAVHPELRRVLGGNVRALDYALTRACSAVKDRSADHLHSIAEREPNKDGRFDSLERASDEALIAVITSQCQHWTHCARAVSILVRRYEDARSAVRSRTFAPIFERFRELGAPDMFVAACQSHAARERDALALYVLVGWSFHSECSPTTTRDHELPASALIDGIPEYAFDPHHTRVGRRAVELWRRTYLVPPPCTPRQIGMALWNVEAAACDRTLDWPVGQDMRRRAYRADLNIRGVPEDHHQELYTWVIREHAALTAARQAAWRSAHRP